MVPAGFATDEDGDADAVGKPDAVGGADAAAEADASGDADEGGTEPAATGLASMIALGVAADVAETSVIAGDCVPKNLIVTTAMTPLTTKIPKTISRVRIGRPRHGSLFGSSGAYVAQERRARNGSRRRTEMLEHTERAGSSV